MHLATLLLAQVMRPSTGRKHAMLPNYRTAWPLGLSHAPSWGTLSSTWEGREWSPKGLHLLPRAPQGF